MKDSTSYAESRVPQRSLPHPSFANTDCPNEASRPPVPASPIVSPPPSPTAPPSSAREAPRERVAAQYENHRTLLPPGEWPEPYLGPIRASRPVYPPHLPQHCRWREGLPHSYQSFAS